MTETDQQSPADNLFVGLHPGLSAEAYHALMLASATWLNEMRRSPGHCREKMLHPGEPTSEMRFGTAAHLAVLEPEKFRTTYVVADQCAAYTSRGGRCSRGGSVRRGERWFCPQHDPLPAEPPESGEAMAQADFDRCLCIADSIQRHPLASAILARRTDTELTGIWRDAESTVKCKMRADIVSRDLDLVADVKTTGDASRAAFERSIFTFGYWIQAPHYLSGISALHRRVRDFVFIAVEKTAPFAVAVYRLRDDVIDAGTAERRRLLELWKRCDESGRWPCFSDEIEDVGLPAWAAREIERIG